MSWASKLLETYDNVRVKWARKVKQGCYYRLAT